MLVVSVLSQMRMHAMLVILAGAAARAPGVRTQLGRRHALDLRGLRIVYRYTSPVCLGISCMTALLSVLCFAASAREVGRR